MLHTTRATASRSISKKRWPNADFYVLFQPQVDLKTHGIVGLEALLRWRRRNGPTRRSRSVRTAARAVSDDPRRGCLGAARSCQQRDALVDQHKRRVRVAVNVSPQQLEQPGFAMYVQQVLKDARLTPELLELEITETVLMRDTGMIQRTLSELREAGVRVVLMTSAPATHHSATYGAIKVDGLKIDRTFIEPLCEEQSARVLVGGIIDLAHQLSSK